jgi:hypothetical protein
MPVFPIFIAENEYLGGENISLHFMSQTNYIHAYITIPNCQNLKSYKHNITALQNVWVYSILLVRDAHNE